MSMPDTEVPATEPEETEAVKYPAFVPDIEGALQPAGTVMRNTPKAGDTAHAEAPAVYVITIVLPVPPVITDAGIITALPSPVTGVGVCVTVGVFVCVFVIVGVIV